MKNFNHHPWLNFQAMGIVNITPDSFSDGGVNLKSNYLKLFLNQDALKFSGLDFGAQSTAPINSKVSLEDELSRLNDHLVPVVESLPANYFAHFKWISIDSYYPEVVLWFKKFIDKMTGGNLKVIWNDVAGKLDDQTVELLKNNPTIDYVFSHNLVPDRLQTNAHMKFVSPTLNSEFINQVSHYFISGLEVLKKYSISKQRIILDPCFGFSKSREQNITLMNHLDQLIIDLGHPRWLIGLSRKSFLRENKDDFKNADAHQLLYLFDFYQKFQDQHLEFIWRLHDPDLFINFIKYCQNYKIK